MTRGERICAFIERYCMVPEGDLIGRPIVLEPFQRKFILEVYDNPAGTRRAYLSMARKNAKTATIACLLLAHIVGPEARLNSRIISGAMSRDQAAEVYNYAAKMVQLSPQLSKLVRIVPSSKRLIGLSRNVEYQAISADSRTAHGKSPVLAILDEVGQVRGPRSDFVDAIVTSQGAYSDAMLFAISTQAPTDADMFSLWLDDARSSGDPRIVCHVYTAPLDCELTDEAAWRAANPALGKFRSIDDVREQADRALRMPSFEPTFRNLVLNQRVESSSPFVSRSTWLLNGRAVDEEAFSDGPVFVGLDLSARTDLTAMVMVAQKGGVWHVKPHFWVPEQGLLDRARRDRQPYDVWVRDGWMKALPGASLDYEWLAKEILEALEGVSVAKVAYDRWRIDILSKEFRELGVELPLQPFGQGFKDMSPAVEALENLLLNGKLAHGNHPVLTMCVANAVAERDPAGNRKLNKARSTGRIDGAVALCMAVGVSDALDDEEDYYSAGGELIFV